jgi:hypothetical protein
MDVDLRHDACLLIQRVSELLDDDQRPILDRMAVCAVSSRSLQKSRSRDVAKVVRSSRGSVRLTGKVFTALKFSVDIGCDSPMLRSWRPGRIPTAFFWCYCASAFAFALARATRRPGALCVAQRRFGTNLRAKAGQENSNNLPHLAQCDCQTASKVVGRPSRACARNPVRVYVCPRKTAAGLG